MHETLARRGRDSTIRHELIMAEIETFNSLVWDSASRSVVAHQGCKAGSSPAPLPSARSRLSGFAIPQQPRFHTPSVAERVWRSGRERLALTPVTAPGSWGGLPVVKRICWTPAARSRRILPSKYSVSPFCNRDHGCIGPRHGHEWISPPEKSRLIISTRSRLYLRDNWKVYIAEFSCQRMAVKLKRISRFKSFPVTSHGPNPIDRAARLRRGDAYPFTFAGSM
jgi:hypothetical protein